MSRIRTACKNTVEFVHSQLADRSLWKKVVVVTEMMLPPQRFKSTHYQKNRCAKDSAEWFTARAADLGLDHIDDIYSVMDDCDLLQSLGNHFDGCSEFWLELDAAQRAPPSRAFVLDNVRSAAARKRAARDDVIRLGLGAHAPQHSPSFSQRSISKVAPLGFDTPSRAVSHFSC